jgi:hypothetical protein
MYKIILILISLGLIVFLAACAIKANVKTDAEKVSSAAMSIADFKPPAGYAPEFTASLGGYTVVAYNPGDSRSHLYLIQSEKEADGEKLSQMLTSMAPGANDPNLRLTVVDNRTTPIRGQEATLVVSEGTNSEGKAYRQLVGTFAGKGGPALLVLIEPAESWDQEAIDAWIASFQ